MQDPDNTLSKSLQTPAEPFAKVQNRVKHVVHTGFVQAARSLGALGGGTAGLEAVNVPDDEIAPPSPDIEAVAHEMLDYMRTDMLRIYLRDLDDFPEQRKRINDRTINTSYRVVAERIADNNPDIDAEAAAAVILGSLINFRVNEALIGDDANGVNRDRFISTWANIYRSVVDPDGPCAGWRPITEDRITPLRDRQLAREHALARLGSMCALTNVTLHRTPPRRGSLSNLCQTSDAQKAERAPGSTRYS